MRRLSISTRRADHLTILEIPLYFSASEARYSLTGNNAEASERIYFINDAQASSLENIPQFLSFSENVVVILSGWGSRVASDVLES